MLKYVVSDSEKKEASFSAYPMMFVFFLLSIFWVFHTKDSFKPIYSLEMVSIWYVIRFIFLNSQ